MAEVGEHIVGLVDSYVVEGVVGEGGFGITYRAARESNGELVAIKQLRLEKLDSWKALELFEREAAVLSSLKHPRIPAYVEFFATTSSGPVAHTGDGTQAPESLVLVQHLVAGTDLSRRMALGESFEPTDVHRTVRQVLEALAYLHELSPPVIHRDVNPRNIVIDDDHGAFLVDFGAIQQRLKEQTVGGSTAVGTLGFMPIEQSLGKARPGSDLYSLAVTTTVLMTGMQPEDLPLDHATSKIDLGELGLLPKPSDPPERQRLAMFLDRALEPIAGQRLESARTALEIMDGKTALVVRSPDALAAAAPSRTRTLFLLFLGGSLGSAGVIYPLNFDNFSETQLVQMAPFWVLPAAFGFIGLLVVNTRRPIANAIIGTVLTGLALVVFLFGIFPSL